MTTDYLIIGAGIIGMAIARELKSRFPERSIVIVEKEADVAYHGSGRNSGVLHAGFYYSADTLKAKFCREGNKAMHEYCTQNNLKINKCGKIVVAQNQDELESLLELERRAKVNGVDVQLITEQQAREFDPNIKTYQYGLYSPTTSTVDPLEVCDTVKQELIDKGIVFIFSNGYRSKINDTTVELENGKHIIARSKIINAAGLYADKIARAWGFSKDYTIILFKGLYLKYHGNTAPVKMNVYPVPNLKNPWLGVHYTVTVDGTVKIGPTSIPSFWRENYNGFDRFSFSELTSVISWEAKLFLLNSFRFREIALDEIKKYRRDYFTSLAKGLVYALDEKGFTEWSRPGIRAQLLDIKNNELVMDFIVEGNNRSVHILNAVSPAFTCSFPFAEWVVENYIA